MKVRWMRLKALAAIRVPLPLKLFLSYVLVLSLTGLPSFIYVRAWLDKDLMRDATRQLTETARRSAATLALLPPDERLSRTRVLASMIGDRVTLIMPSGDVVFDSEVQDPARMDNHAQRPEVQAALQGASGDAVRHSDTTGKNMLYVAVHVLNPKNDVVAVLRLAREVSTIEASTLGLSNFTRNVQAFAISVALGLSLLSAVRFMRPLQRVTRTAKALADGDLAAHSGVSSNDEVGDVGVALDHMSVEIRRRLASAGSGDAVLAQLIDVFELPCVILENSGEVLAQNGAARRNFYTDGINAGRRMRELVASPLFVRALAAAEADGEPQAIALPIEGSDKSASARLHVLKRPGVAPLFAVFGESRDKPDGTTLPPPDSVRTRLFADVLTHARVLAQAEIDHEHVAVELNDVPHVHLVDIGDKATQALAQFLADCATHAKGRTRVVVRAHVADVRVELTADVELPQAAVMRALPLIEVMGGSLRGHAGEATLWLPRA